MVILWFHLPFGGTLDPENRWVLLSALIPWEELEETYGPQISPTICAAAKPLRLTFGALFIKQHMGLSGHILTVLLAYGLGKGVQPLVQCSGSLVGHS